jgi:hypothetical protein
VIDSFFQALALQLFSDLWLYIPSENARDAQSKYSVQKTITKTLTGNSKHKRITRFYQCQCGVDHTTGRFAARTRQVPWRNVGCLSWIKLVTLHDSEDGIYYVFERNLTTKSAYMHLNR